MIRSLLAGAIDYAGLFPPAALPMAEAARNYAAYRSGTDAWALGRFVVPTSRLEELAAAAELHAGERGGAWPLSALVAGDGAADLATIETFNARYASRTDGWAGVVDMIEARADDVAAATALASRIPKGLPAFVEVPVASDPVPVLEVLARHGLAAKVRTGGTTQAQFPAPEQVARFLRACDRLDLPFKATAGLHHPLRAEYPLTYEPASARGTMYGFLNVLLAAALVRAGGIDDDVIALLEERDPQAIEIGRDAIAWRGHRFTAASLAGMRTRFALSFGSCSFEEPLADLRSLGLL